MKEIYRAKFKENTKLATEILSHIAKTEWCYLYKHNLDIEMECEATGKKENHEYMMLNLGFVCCEANFSIIEKMGVIDGRD